VTEVRCKLLTYSFMHGLIDACTLVARPIRYNDQSSRPSSSHSGQWFICVYSRNALDWEALVVVLIQCQAICRVRPIFPNPERMLLLADITRSRSCRKDLRHVFLLRLRG